MPDDVEAQKKALRLEMKARRDAPSEIERERASRSMCGRISRFLSTRSERTIGVYLARPAEISLDVLIGELLRKNYEIAAPRVDMERGEMSFWRLETLDAVEIGPWHVREPLVSQKIKEIPILLVPGLAFDAAGARLGMGGGWYDRTMQATQTAIGVCFDCQLIARVPLEMHDRRVHFLATESRWIETEN
ncbi:5-formyltetrahydrofolate cyclo-ligase [Abditibacterium utsteinense]|uniref:5-formyltetrahydrofolate cyclo-ligase n=1 Tax=Abditibacterium utsteinense TaxID=1960156 RepID=A0A2S8STL7_9BACT|nr:5-formyltetrahydrofolate cyclo-ligase [Abditibacterium utsteinense]PQV64126.1 5-formyltetrahydrofolate cyclo-ligase [Abditibacterium utsteinense]